ncbi:MAG: PAS domain S-box protein [Candidatus Bathyarchaeota archaeon]|nr:PAS domain S-box protein [Candidatus Bathyarchaeota archaeon]
MNKAKNMFLSDGCKESGIDMRVLLEAALAGIEGSFFVLDTNYRYVFFNIFHKARMKGLYGIDIARGLNILECIPNAVDRAKLKANVDEALTGKSVEEQTKISGDKQKPTWVLARHAPVKAANRKIVGVSVFTVDLSKELKMQAALRVSEEKYRQIVNAAHEGILILDTQGKVTFVNKILADWVGYKVEELMGKSAFKFAPKKELQQAYSHWEKRKSGAPESYDFKVQAKDGSDVWLIISGAPLKDGYGYFAGTLAMFSNITARKKTEIACKEAEERFRALVESTSDVIWQVDEDGVYTYVSPKIKDVLGYDPTEVVGKTPFDLLAQEDCEKILSQYVDIANRKEPFYNLENWNVAKDGSLVLLETSGVPIIDEKGQLRGYRGIDRDITDRKKAQDTLGKSEEKFAKAFNNSPIAITITRLEDGAVLDINESTYSLFGFSREEAIGKSSTDLGIWGNADQRVNFTRTLLSDGYLRNHEYEMYRKGGDKVVVNVSAELIEINGEDCILSSFIDVTERKRMEAQIEEYNKRLEALVAQRTAQLREAERLAAIGQTAGMVGHDLRNPLQTIVGELYLAKIEISDIDDSDPGKAKMLESLQNLSDQVSYMDKIVSDLQTFVKPVTVQKQMLDLKQLISGVLTQVDVPRNVECTLDVKALSAYADPQLLKRVLINLVTNAVQAMPNGGRLTVASTYIDGQKSVEVVVSDTGTGISDEIKPKLFMPLFTTKAKGQGFGLAVCKRVIEAQGGNIRFESTEGQGTTFFVTLPTN